MDHQDRQHPNTSLERELAIEQRHVDTAYARLDAMRDAARHISEAYVDVQRGGTHQARLERDIAYDLTERRLAELEIGNSPLVFGRLDLGEPHPATWYVGRLAVDDTEHNPLVLDWRAPVAEPFYRATAVAPMGVARRRHLITRNGREVTALDDEIFDTDAARSGDMTVAGEGALFAALERERTGRMGDIVATIQAEQDEAIRADLPGILVVTGGPGTGKTAVALHRAAYLLYTYRRRLAGNGVLLIGPSPVFLRYIEQVLPSLGEQDVQLATIGALRPSLAGARAIEDPASARVKGDARMTRVIANAVRDRQRPLPRELAFVIDGLRLRVSRHDTAQIVQGAQRKRGTHNERVLYVSRRLLDVLVGRYKQAATNSYQRGRLDRGGGNDTPQAGLDALVGRALARGEQLPEGWDGELRNRLRRRPEVRAALDRMWPPLTGTELLNDLYGFSALVRSAARGVLPDADIALLLRPRADDHARAEWSEADIALVDEADSLLGPISAARPRRKRQDTTDLEALDAATRVMDTFDVVGYMSAADLAARHGGAVRIEDMSAEPRTFGHVLVDEAQDLSAMQWRMLARRCPSGSFTIVGDPGQASRPGAIRSWDDALAQLPVRTPPRTATLSVNYRTPAEIMDVAARLLAVAAPGVAPSRSVRHTGTPPEFRHVAAADLLAESVRTVRSLPTRGTRAVIAPTAMHAALEAALADDGAATGVESLDAPIAILDATAAKGLEFDNVVVVEPHDLVAADAAGLRLLYVTITRATHSLVIVHAAPLPEGLTA